MKYLRLLPICLSALALPLVLTGCKPAGEDTSSTAGDTNATPATASAPAAESTNAAAPAPAPAAADTNAAPAATTNAPAGT